MPLDRQCFDNFDTPAISRLLRPGDGRALSVILKYALSWQAEKSKNKLCSLGQTVLNYFQS
jgi:hypothetical protein